MKYFEIPANTPDDEFVFIECDITGKTKKTRYGVAKKNVERNQGKYITNWGLAKLNNPMKNDKVKEKVKKTNLERYGTNCPLNTKEKIQERVEKMFGTQEAIDARNEKTKQTNIERYGAEHIMYTEEGKKRQIETMQEKYGVDHPLQSEEIKEKARQTCQEKYGVDNPCQSPEVRAKMAQTNMERYGVSCYNQLPEMKEYLKNNCETWLKASWENPWAKGITRPEEWNEKQRETVMELMDQGKWNVGPKFSIKGFYQSQKCRRKNPMFRSSYELKTHWHLDNDPNVEWYDYEPFRITYTDTENKKRYYVVDFVVKYYNLNKLLAIEVKNDYAERLFIESGKVKAFINECNDYIDFIIWSNDTIDSLNLDTKTLLLSEKVIEI